MIAPEEVGKLSMPLSEFVKEHYDPVVKAGHFCGWKFIGEPIHYDIEDYDPNMTVSIICVCWMRSNHLPEIFFSFTNQNWPKEQIEILVLDDNSPTIPEGYPDKEHFRKMILKLMRKYSDWKIRAFETNQNVTYNHALSTNILGKRAANDLLIFCDGDVAMLTKDYILACVKHHSRVEKLWLTAMMWQTERELYTDVRTVPEFEDRYRHHFWTYDWRNPPRDKFFLGLEPMVTNWRGGSMKREYYVKVRGNDERSRGWGNMDIDLFGRLSRVNFSFACDWALPAGHLPHPYWVKRPSEATKKMLRPFDAWPAGTGVDICNDNLMNNRIVVNDENWGEIDTLEEIKIC